MQSRALTPADRLILAGHVFGSLSVLLFSLGTMLRTADRVPPIMLLDEDLNNDPYRTGTRAMLKSPWHPGIPVLNVVDEINGLRNSANHPM